MNHLRTTTTNLAQSHLRQRPPSSQTSLTSALTRSKSTGTRGSRGHGWLKKYRDGLGGRHLQGRWHYRDVEELKAINDEVFGMNQLLMAKGDSEKVPTEAYLDLSVAGEEPRRVVIELAAAALPKTTENFRLLCQEKPGASSENGEEVVPFVGYASTNVYKIEKTVGLCLGDVVTNNGSGGRCHPALGTPTSPYSFRDEGHFISHTQPGIVSMMSPGVHRNDSRFLITTRDAPQLDGRFVAFGRVKDDGMDAVFDIFNGVFTKRGRPTVEIKVTGCGVL
eukprot:CAMPEP_0171341072 /NCGR_PEP_ID=MMETSP0878-20121228/8943_1 /TAXON_ID=67004 /ORGANISM="Thalassiosira weissflogii, Strain CCMP1336" /LENGTH=278 /DNA_ID=CAMNT_0011843199 /DNA_START=19 /DNA_END=855 /DNA_ORIENTATION=-